MSEPISDSFVTFEEFSRVKLVIGKVIHAESMPGMKKLFKVKVDIGTEQRELAVGAAQYYSPTDFIGKTVVVCKNLEPKKLGGMISSGMLLAADGPEGRPIFLTVNEEAPAGSPIH
jgi:methionine--tRNA ligase beta chain